MHLIAHALLLLLEPHQGYQNFPAFPILTDRPTISWLCATLLSSTPSSPSSARKGKPISYYRPPPPVATFFASFPPFPARVACAAHVPRTRILSTMSSRERGSTCIGGETTHAQVYQNVYLCFRLTALFRHLHHAWPTHRLHAYSAPPRKPRCS